MRYRLFIRGAYLIIGIIILAGCADDFPHPPFIARLERGDYHVGWSLSYFDSWKRDRQPKYLLLAEKHIVSAINMYSELETETSPRITDFYVIRDRRTRSCRLLAEMQFEATNYGYSLRKSTPDGCIF